MGALTTDDVRHWDLSVVEQMFETASLIHGAHHNLGEALENGQQRIQGWEGESGDACRAELGKVRVDVNDSGREAERTYQAVRFAAMDISGAKLALDEVDSEAESFGWSITQNWTLDTSATGGIGLDSATYAAEVTRLQAAATQAKSYAERADHELAVAVRAAVGDARLTPDGREVQGPPQAPGQTTPDTVPGPHQGDPGYQTGMTPTLAGSPGDHPPMSLHHRSSDTVPLVDNPPGYNGPAGAERDAAWQRYLSAHDGTTAGSVGQGLVLPNPDAVSDPGLKTLGAAAKQQGVSYAWGGGHVPGKTGVSNGWAQAGDRSETYKDGNRVGFDCAGLARFAMSEGHGGLDISAGPGNSGNTVGQYASLLAAGGRGTAIPDSALQPGDLIYFGTPGSSEHVAVYAGNGLVVQAHQSGEPVEVSPFDLGWTHRAVHVGN